MYAIIEDSGTQIRVNEGDVIKVALRDLPADQASIVFDRVLYLGGREGQAATIGAPLVAGASVAGDVLGREKEPRVTILKYRRRKNYRRKRGHRQGYLSVKITAIRA